MPATLATAEAAAAHQAYAVGQEVEMNPYGLGWERATITKVMQPSHPKSTQGLRYRLTGCLSFCYAHMLRHITA